MSLNQKQKKIFIRRIIESLFVLLILTSIGLWVVKDNLVIRFLFILLAIVSAIAHFLGVSIDILGGRQTEELPWGGYHKDIYKNSDIEGIANKNSNLLKIIAISLAVVAGVILLYLIIELRK